MTWQSWLETVEVWVAQICGVGNNATTKGMAGVKPTGGIRVGQKTSKKKENKQTLNENRHCDRFLANLALNKAIK